MSMNRDGAVVRAPEQSPGQTVAADLSDVAPDLGFGVPGKKKPHLLGMTRTDLESLLKSWGEPAYRGRQIARWIYLQGTGSVDKMTDLPAALRDRLRDDADLTRLSVIRRQKATDGTEKFLFGLQDGQAIESVVLPFTERTSICVSSQVGCPIRCTFCATGRSGYARNLTTGEIVEQLLDARRLTGRAISHVVFMGMGEPMLNLRSVLKACSPSPYRSMPRTTKSGGG